MNFRRAADRLLFAPVDIASLAIFRILFGLLMAAAMVRFLAKGWVREFYVEPNFHFTYPGFGWVEAWPSFWMHPHFIVLAIAALMVAAGLCYRFAIILFFLGFTYVELIDQTAYLNHYYLISLLALLMIFMPANRAWSLDAHWRPSLRVEQIPQWPVTLLRFQIGVVYFFAGLAKLNPDWMLRAQPLRIWLATLTDLPVVGPLMDDAWLAYAASWTGAIYDLAIVFLLLSARTRLWAYAAVIAFHVATWVFFRIGMFPWIMIVATLIFFPPNWPRRWLKQTSTNSEADDAQSAPVPNAATVNEGPRRWIISFITVYAALQIFLPLRHLLHPGPAAWNFKGFNFAWNVMIAEKTGLVEFYAFDPESFREFEIPARDYITPRQELFMSQDPELIRQLAIRMGEDLRRAGTTNMIIRVEAYAALNGHPSQRLIDPDVDLSRPITGEWIVPFEQ